MASEPLQPPVPFADFEFAFDPALSTIFPNPPPLPPSADLFSPDETTDLLGFLDNFGDLGWDSLAAPAFEPFDRHPAQHHPHPHHAPYSNPHLHTAPDQSTSARSRAAHTGVRDRSTPPSSASASTATPTPGSHPTPPSGSADAQANGARNKPLLSTPQKRLNHIMSEQKRRNAIRDGYAQLIALMAPAGAIPGLGMPTRGRPKGSGSRGKGESKGKSGVLFRAVEYCRWLEEGRAALRDEVARVEKAVAAIGLRG